MTRLHSIFGLRLPRAKECFRFVKTIKERKKLDIEDRIKLIDSFSSSKNEIEYMMMLLGVMYGPENPTWAYLEQ